MEHSDPGYVIYEVSAGRDEVDCSLRNGDLLFVRLSDVFLQEEFDGVLREEVVAEALYHLGRSGSGTEQVYLNLTLSVSVMTLPLAGSILTPAGPQPFSLVLIAFVVAPDFNLAFDGVWQ